MKYWENHPKDFFVNALGEEYNWDGMDKMFEAIPRAMKEHKPLIVSSGHALSKDYTMSGMMLWFAYCYVPSKVIFTAPTDRQVKNIMWAELKRKWEHKKVSLPGTLLTCNLDIQPDWFILGFTTKETGGMVGKFQGFHSPSVMVLVSEAQAVPDTIFDEIDGIMTSPNSLLVMIGNPLRTTGRFAKAIKDKKKNIVIELSCLDNPNYKEKREVVPGLASHTWVEDKRERWGETDPRWISRVLGKLPTTSINTVFSDNLITSCVNKVLSEVVEKRVVSCDPARFGDDDMVIYGMISGQVVKNVIKSKQDYDATASDCLIMQREMDADAIIVECDGLGSGVISHLKNMKGKDDTFDIIESYASGKVEGWVDSKFDDDMFQNHRVEMWFYALEQARMGHLSIPADDYLTEELLEVQYLINPKTGKTQLENKEDIKERLGRSPDRADAFIQAVWGLQETHQVKKKDPYTDEDESDMVASPDMGPRGKGYMAA